jgi:hypothetical protein
MLMRLLGHAGAASKLQQMTSGLTKPKNNLFRTFLYLDAQEVVNSLSALEGGEVDEVLTRIAEEGGGELGGEVAAGPIRGRAGKRKQRKLEEEVRRRRTEYSAASALLRLLHEQEAIGVLSGSYDQDVYEQLEEQMLLELRGNIRIHPLHQMLSAGRAWLAAAPTFGIPKADIQTARELVQIFEAMSQSTGERLTFLAFVETSADQATYRLVVPIQEQYLLVPLDDFVGRATFVAQVDRILRDDEELLALRLLRNAPPLPLEREGILEALPDLLSAFQELGIAAALEDFVLAKPTVILKPIVIFK